MKKAVIKVNEHGEKFVLFFREWLDNGVCSNWYMSDFTVDGEKFNCVEQYMMYRKAILFNNKQLAKEILAEKEPKNMKEYGRRVKRFNQDIWDKHKFEIVFTGVYNKFNQNNELRQWLIEADADYFVEASPYDAIWGIKLGVDDMRCLNTDQWKGENLLGKAIKEARNKIIGI